MWLIVGLGNPGRKYERNRHNIGFRVVDELVRRHAGLAPASQPPSSSNAFRDRFGSQFTQAMFGTTKVSLQKPMEYMNRSGYAVQRAVGYYNFPIDEIIVIHDDIDLELGRTKLKSGGGHGGHNGLRSLIEQLGSRDFLRVRCGIGRPGPEAGPDRLAADDKRVTGYVLGDFPAAQASVVDQLVDRAAAGVESIVDDGLVAAMNKFNSNPNQGAKDLES